MKMKIDLEGIDSAIFDAEKYVVIWEGRERSWGYKKTCQPLYKSWCKSDLEPNMQVEVS
jgi:hypothetical protein